MTKPSMVVFPNDGDDDGDWTDSGEGGLYVMALIPAPEYPDDAWQACSIDTQISLGLPRVCLSPEARDFWPPLDEVRELWDDERMIREALEKAGHEELAIKAGSLHSVYRDSGTMLAALHMGSTGGSMRSDRLGGYFEATPETLTDEGRALLSALRAGFGVEPVLATFLDT